MSLAELVKWTNTTGCEPAIHGFESRIPPHFQNLTPICDKKFGVFSLFIYTKVYIKYSNFFAVIT